jgi:hypothetical protein
MRTPLPATNSSTGPDACAMLVTGGPSVRCEEGGGMPHDCAPVARRKSLICRGYSLGETTACRGCGRIFNLRTFTMPTDIGPFQHKRGLNVVLRGRVLF